MEDEGRCGVGCSTSNASSISERGGQDTVEGRKGHSRSIEPITLVLERKICS